MVSTQRIILARKHLGGAMESSARLCLEDAVRLHNDGFYQAAGIRALKSLSYSIGILHPDYQRAARTKLPAAEQAQVLRLTRKVQS